MIVTTTKEEKNITFSLRGILDTLSASQFRSSMFKEASKPAQTINLDLSGLADISIGGLRLLLMIGETAKAHGSIASVINVPENIGEKIDKYGFTGIFSKIMSYSKEKTKLDIDLDELSAEIAKSVSAGKNRGFLIEKTGNNFSALQRQQYQINRRERRNVYATEGIGNSRMQNAQTKTQAENDKPESAVVSSNKGSIAGNVLNLFRKVQGQ